MASTTPGSRAASPSGIVVPGSVTHGSVSLFSPSPASPSTSTAATSAVFTVLPLCLMAEDFNGERFSEDYLQQFTTGGRLSRGQIATIDNRPY